MFVDPGLCGLYRVLDGLEALGNEQRGILGDVNDARVIAPIGFTLRFDGDSQRLILEAREPVSGYLIVQIPPTYVVKQFSATVRANLEPSRCKGLNDAV